MIFAAAGQAQNHRNTGYQQTHPVRFGHALRLTTRAINSLWAELMHVTILIFIGTYTVLLNDSVPPKTFLNKKLCTINLLSAVHFTVCKNRLKIKKTALLKIGASKAQKTT
jgi:hypothetical protein